MSRKRIKMFFSSGIAWLNLWFFAECFGAKPNIIISKGFDATICMVVFLALSIEFFAPDERGDRP